MGLTPTEHFVTAASCADVSASALIHAREVARLVDTDGCLKLARHHGISALLARTIDRTGLSEQLPATLVEELRCEREVVAERADVLVSAALPMFRAFGDSDISFLIRRGFVQSIVSYGDPGIRYFRDIDLRVHPDDGDRAQFVLDELGFADADIEQSPTGLRSRSLPLKQSDVPELVVGLSTKVFSEHSPYHVDVSDIFSRSSSVVVGDHRFPCYALADAFVDNATHFFKHATSPRLMRWLADLRLSKFEDVSRTARALTKPDWEIVLREVRKAEIERPVAFAIRHTATVDPGAFPKWVREIAADWVDERFLRTVSEGGVEFAWTEPTVVDRMFNMRRRVPPAEPSLTERPGR